MTRTIPSRPSASDADGRYGIACASSCSCAVDAMAPSPRIMTASAFPAHLHEKLFIFDSPLVLHSKST